MSKNTRIKLHNFIQKFLLVVSFLVLVFAAIMTKVMSHAERLDLGAERRRAAVASCRKVVIEAQRQKLETVTVPQNLVDRVVVHADIEEERSNILTLWFYSLLTLLGVQSAGFILLHLFSPSREMPPLAVQ